MAGPAAAAGKDAAGGQHAMDVIGLGFGPHQDDVALFGLGPALGRIGVKGNLADGRAGRYVQAVGQQVAAGDGRLLLGRVELRMQEEIDVLRLYPQDGLGAADELLVGQVHGDAHGGLRGAFGVTGLEHPQLAALDGEFHVLDFAVVLLQLAADALKLAVDGGHLAA